jgi:hypothetical protein
MLKGGIKLLGKLLVKAGRNVKSDLRKIVQKEIEEDVTKKAGGKIMYLNYFRGRHPVVCFAVCMYSCVNNNLSLYILV